MSGPSYEFNTPRTRPPPPPLRLQKSQNSALTSAHSTSQTLLYDLPPSTSTLSPPASPAMKPNVISPSSPSLRPRGRRNGNGHPGPPPPPTSRNRSITPLGVSRSELESFAELCRAWYAFVRGHSPPLSSFPSSIIIHVTRYFNQDEASGRQVTQILANLPSAQRAPFSRLQASIRSAYHANVNARRHAEFQAHLNATQPGGSLLPHSRANPNGPVAQKERFDRLDRFVKTWCTMGMPGTKPFFEALWAVMRLQVVPEHLGGAGANRLHWEFDDAVFKESA